MKIDHPRLRSLLTDLSSATSGEWIAPFGFELLGRASFKFTEIRRIYAYTNLPFDVATLREVVETSYPDLWNSVAWVIQPDETSAGPAAGQDRGVFLYASHVPERDLIASYSSHVLGAILRLHEGTLPEWQSFEFKASARRFVFQLSVIAGALVSSEYKVSPELARLIRLQEDRSPTTGQSVLRRASREEYEVWNAAGLPLISSAASHLVGSTIMEVCDFNSVEFYKCAIDQEGHHLWSQTLVQAYARFSKAVDE